MAHRNNKTPLQKRRKLDQKVDQQSRQSFPASDPPSYSGGNHIVGAPKQRESQSPSADSAVVVEAEKKVRKGEAKRPHLY